MPTQRNPWGRPYAGQEKKKAPEPVSAVETTAPEPVSDAPKKKSGRPKKEDND